MSRSLKIVFEVIDEATKEVAVAKSQITLSLGTDPRKNLTIEGLARDFRAERDAILEHHAVKPLDRLTDGDRDALLDIALQQRVVEENMMGAGDIIQRFIRLRLLDWAVEKQKEPT